LWAIDGWDQANYVSGEMVNPEKNLPRAIHCSMAIVTVRLFLDLCFIADPFLSGFIYDDQRRIFFRA
jgi:amino acid transporter